MAVDFSKFDKTVDLEGLKSDVKEASENTNANYKEVPHDTYEVEITKLELGESKKHDPMFTCWMKILEGEYKGSLIFMNQVVTQGFQLHIVNNFLRDLTKDMNISIEFESYREYAKLIDSAFELIKDRREYAVEYGEKKGFNTFEIKDVFEVE